jgi:signal transduction histidine kinase
MATQFVGPATEWAISVEGELRQEAEALLLIRALYEASTEVEHDEFRTFAAIAIERHPAIEALAWVPVTSAALTGSASPFPVAYFAPETNPMFGAGTELSATGGWSAALAAVRDSGVVELPDVSGPGTLARRRLTAALAVYRNGVPRRTTADRRAALAGFLIGVLRADTIVERRIAMVAAAPVGLDVRLYDHANGTRLLYSRPSRARRNPELTRLAGDVPTIELHQVRHFRVGDRPFAIVVSPAPQFFVLHPVESGLVLPILGLIATVIACAYVWERCRAEEAREDRLAVTTALARVGQDLLAIVETPAVLDRLGELTVRAVGCDDSRTWLPDSTDDAWVATAGYGIADEARTPSVRVPRGLWTSILRRLDRDGHLQITADDDDPRAVEMLHRVGATALLCVPLRNGSDLIGFQTAAYRARAGTFSKAQEEIACGVARLASLALTNARMVETLATANRLKGEFVSTMSHELRTPLNVILGYGEFLRDPAFTHEDRASFIDKIEHQGKQLLELIENVLQVEKLESGNETLVVAPVGLREIWSTLAADFADHARHPGVALEWIPVPDVRFETDAQKIKMVVRNLVRNALKFTEHGSVRAEATVEGENVVVRVTDTGIGIATEDHDTIFELFRQADGSDTRRFSGTGVGLFIVRKFVEQLQGRVSVTSRVGEGSTFVVVLPACARSAHASERGVGNSGQRPGLVLSVHRHHARAAEADVVLERETRALDLTLLRLPVQLPDELRALREPGRAERMPLREKPARGVHDPLPAVRHLVVVDELAALAGLAELQALVRDELVRREAVVELDHVDVLGTDARLLVDLRRRPARHADADEPHRALAEVGDEVGRERLADDLHGLRVPVLGRVLRRAEDRGASAVRGRTALQQRQRVVDHARREHLLERARVLILRARGC